MPHPPIRLIAFDLDGTILNTEKDVSPRTRAALQAAHEKGVILLPATGRTLANLAATVTALPGVRYAMTSNGAALWDLGSDPAAAVRSRWGENQGTPAGRLPADAACIGLSPLPTAQALAVYDCLVPFLPGNLKAFVHGRSVCEPPCYAWEQAHGSAGFRPGPGLSTVVPDLRAYLAARPDTLEKVCMFFRDLPTLRAARSALTAIPGITVVQGSPDNLEITAPCIDKGSGLQAICKLLGVPVEQTLALGDSENDLGMLRDAGVAGVMANGTPEALAMADIVSPADNDHDGAARLIEQLCL